MGRTSGDIFAQPFKIQSQQEDDQTTVFSFDGAINENGDVLGTYIHGLFHNIKLRQSVLSHIAQLKNLSIVFSKERQALDQEYDKLAEWVRTSIDMDLIYKMTGLEKIHNTQ